MHLRKELERLRREQIYANLEKCDFFLDSVSILRNVISGEVLSVDPEKVKVIVEWGRPTNVDEIQSFLGLTGYYRHFIERFSKLSGLLTTLTRKSACYLWLNVCKESF